MHDLEFEQEHWDSACDNMPQEYVDAIVAMTMPKVKPPPSELNLLEMRLKERQRRQDEERERRWRESYRLVRIKRNPDGSISEHWAPVKEAVQ